MTPGEARLPFVALPAASRPDVKEIRFLVGDLFSVNRIHEREPNTIVSPGRLVAAALVVAAAGRKRSEAEEDQRAESERTESAPEAHRLRGAV